jgi:hypothetical protein
MFFGAPVSIKQWWLWNQLPVTLGNIVSGAFFTGLALYFTFSMKTAHSDAPPAFVPQIVSEIKLDQTAAEAQVP